MCTQCTIVYESARLRRSKAEILSRCEKLGATKADMRSIPATEEQMRTWDGRAFGEESRRRSARIYQAGQISRNSSGFREL